MLSVQIQDATPSQIEAHRRRQAFWNSFAPAPVISVVNGTNEPTPLTTEQVHSYVEEQPEPAPIEVAPIDVRYVKGSATSILKIICKACAYHLNVDLKEIQSKDRLYRIVRARQVAFVVTKAITGWSLVEIGRRFDKDHTTILCGLRKIEKLKAKDRDFADKIERITADVIAAIRVSCPEFTLPGERQRDVPEQPGQGTGENSVSRIEGVA